jgi:hypothetical protein
MDYYPTSFDSMSEFEKALFLLLFCFAMCINITIRLGMKCAFMGYPSLTLALLGGGGWLPTPSVFTR